MSDSAHRAFKSRITPCDYYTKRIRVFPLTPFRRLIHDAFRGRQSFLELRGLVDRWAGGLPRPRYSAAMFSLSRAYIVPTYLVLGLATACVRIAVEPAEAPPLRFDAWFLKRLAFASALFIAATYVFIRVTVRWS